MAKLRNYARDVETGDPFVTGNATITGPDGSTLATPALNGTTGAWEYQANGQPGVMTQEYAASGQTKIVAGDAYGQAGDWCEAELSRILQLFGDGVINDMAVTAPGSMNVQVGTGNLLNKGILHPIYTAENVAIGAADGSNPRIDRVVSRLTRTGTFAGKVVLAVVAGTAAASPAAPALTQDANTWEVEVARVTVPAAASSIVLGNISTASRSIATGPVADGSVTTAKLADNSVTSAKIVDGTIVLADLADGLTLPFLTPGMPVDLWWSALSVVGGDATKLSIAQDTLYATPIFVPRPTTLKGLGVERDADSSTSSATGRLGLYTTGTDGLPADLVRDAGTVNLSTNGVKTVTGLSDDLDAGWYWAVVCAGSFTGTLYLTGAISDSARRALFGTAAAGDESSRNFSPQRAFSGTGSLPSSFAATTILASAPLVWVQTAGS